MKWTLLVLLMISIAAYAIFYFFKVLGKETQLRTAKLNNSKEAYSTSLSELKNNPNNAELKQQALLKGREFSAMTRERNNQGFQVTIYDEVALMNDINAACADATSSNHSNSLNSKSPEERLANLFNLKRKNLISEEEYEARRHKILDEI